MAGGPIVKTLGSGCQCGYGPCHLGKNRTLDGIRVHGVAPMQGGSTETIAPKQDLEA